MEKSAPPPTATSSNEHEKEEEEEVDEELASPNLYEESMAEITFNETRDGGHDDDPFDRSGEYDEDVNLTAPPPITPDIPDVPPKILKDRPKTSSEKKATTEEEKQ
ncbi:unnamed protein product [Caenorhabditis sp. 36 PRJEB53466]|nr:unnamed protein product [Caenorhabditis sp. 36 PRJEB53466]